MSAKILLVAVSLATSYYYDMWELHRQGIRVKWEGKTLVEIPLPKRPKGFIKKIAITWASLLVLGSFIVDDKKEKRAMIVVAALLIGVSLALDSRTSRIWQKIIIAQRLQRAAPAALFP